MNIGNYWEYRADSPQGTYYLSNRVLKDTVLSNNKTYKKIELKLFEFNTISYVYERFENNRVYSFYNIDSMGCQTGENIIYDFNFMTPAVWANCPPFDYNHAPYRGYKEKYFRYIPCVNLSCEFRVFSNVSITGADTIWDPLNHSFPQLIARGIGKPQIMADDFAGFLLTGAIINGIRYGVIVNIEKISAIRFEDKIKLYPNPCNNSTKIDYGISQPGLASIVLYNSLGEKILTLLNEYKMPGYYAAPFRTTDLSSGVYFVVLRADKIIQTKKLVLLK